MATKSSTTKNRRQSTKATQPKGRVTRKAPQNSTGTVQGAENKVVAKRLSRLPDKERKAAATAFTSGVPVAEIAEKYKLRLSNARYMVRQELVRQGKVSKISPTDVKALRKAMDDPNYGDAAWVACRAGISGSKLTDLIGK